MPIDGAYASPPTPWSALPWTTKKTVTSRLPPYPDALSIVRATERDPTDGSDLYRKQTWNVRIKGVKPRDRCYTVFVPSAHRKGVNYVHVYFSAGDVDVPGGKNHVLAQGLRSASDNSEWILIAVPFDSVQDSKLFPYKDDDPRAFAITTDTDIQLCLQAVTGDPGISRLKITAHSRGVKSLIATLGQGLIKSPTLELVATFDQSDESVRLPDKSYLDLASVLAPKHLTRVEKIYFEVLPGRHPPDLEKLVVPNGRRICLPYDCMVAIVCSRLINDAYLDPDHPLPADIEDLLLKLPHYGLIESGLGGVIEGGSEAGFTTQRGAKNHICDFCSAPDVEKAVAKITKTQRLEYKKDSYGNTKPYCYNALTDFINNHNLLNYLPNLLDRALCAHELFVGEVVRDIIDYRPRSPLVGCRCVSSPLPCP